MNHYIDVTLKPDAEMRENLLLNMLYSKLHKLLPQYGGRIGLDFPSYRKKLGLGAVIRVLGVEQDLQALQHQLTHAHKVAEYALITSVGKVPESVAHFARYTRVHAKGNSYINRLKKRHQARGTCTDELEAAIRCKASVRLDLPHINLRSESTEQNLILFINRARVTKPVAGLFNGYGLSSPDSATVPLFG